ANNQRGYALVDQTDVESLARAFAEALLRQRLAHAKHLSEKRLNLALDSAEEGLWDYYPQDAKIYYSPRWFGMLGYTEGELPYSIETWATLAHPDDLAGLTVTFESVTRGDEITFRKELRMLCQHGQWRWVQVRGRTVEWDTGGKVFRIVGTMVDIGKYKQVELALQKANEELQRLAALDDLTQIANRRRFEERLTEEWRRARRNNTPLGVIICDIDFFKSYNDTYGHLKGDETLYTVAQTISTTLKRPMDMVARYGGEEFAMILPNTDPQGALRVAEEIRSAMDEQSIPHQASKVHEYITLSYGVVAMVAEGDTPAKALLELADKALYKAKALGRNRIVAAGSLAE
ncbi:MAG: sensor domain-containing diguanylate cyclase, partial [Desulfatitalea sp.]|nr:sensor domain-containing diguanylate cyclase [Desulfatitalea sp.]